MLFPDSTRTCPYALTPFFFIKVETITCEAFMIKCSPYLETQLRVFERGKYENSKNLLASLK